MTVNPRQGAPKSQAEIAIHPGMRSMSRSGIAAPHGHSAAAIDAATGMQVVPGTYAESVTAGNPLTAPPVAKPDAAPLQPVIGHRNRRDEVSAGAVGQYVNDKSKQTINTDLAALIVAEAKAHSAKFDAFNDGAAELHKGK